jgi:hypothetical protein
MKIEDQVCSLELAKRLKELGVKQESLFWWDTENEELMESGLEGMPRFIETDKTDRRKRVYVQYPGRTISALSVAELGEILSSYTLYNFYDMPNIVESGEWQWEHNGMFGYGKTEADARAAMLIYLAENTLVSPPTPQHPELPES